MQVALQWHIDLTIVTGQLRQTGGLKRRAKQTAGYTWRMTEGADDQEGSQAHKGKRGYSWHVALRKTSFRFQLPGFCWATEGQLTLALV